ncbi:MAG: precorrin-3B synthase [Hyphomicrobiaceae bacterium]
MAGDGMSHVEIKGWCPGALRPMLSGDGLIVRIKPFACRISAAQAHGLADAARTHGNGMIDLSSRANLQLRGVRPETYAALFTDLDKLGLLDPSPEEETRRNIIVTPFPDDAGDSALSAYAIATELERCLAASDLALPGKFGFAVDCGCERVLGTAPADVRIERYGDNALLVRADGAPMGLPVTAADAASKALALARWFLETGGGRGGHGRMSAHVRAGTVLPAALAGRRLPMPAAQAPRPGLTAHGALVAVAFGSMKADTLDAIAGLARELRLTPWRMIFLPSVDQLPVSSDVIVAGDDPILRVEACPGAPTCAQALGETRALARRLAPSASKGRSLHVSGCAKGCASASAKSVTIIATAAGYDIVENGIASDPPVATGLSPAELLSRLPAVSENFDRAHL